MKKKLLASLLAVSMLVSLFPVSALAAKVEAEDTALCPHHLEHTAECDYIAPSAGAPCQHEHTAECWQEETNCIHIHTEDCYSDGVLPMEGEEGAADTCPHICTEESGCVIRTLDCQHEHDEDCGYLPADSGTPCGYVCRICPVQALIDALSDPEGITPDNRANAESQLAAIDEARAELTDEETTQLDTSRYQAVVSALLTLNGQARADVPLLADDPAEQFPVLTPGETYWFDLSGAGIPGTVNEGNDAGAVSIPDTTLHWVPFTYTGTINAYVLNSNSSGQAGAAGDASQTTDSTAQYGYTYAHSLFIADYVVTYSVSWNNLNNSNLIFGKSYTSGGVDYTMRAPSAGSGYSGTPTGSGYSGTPTNNEWDMILDKGSDYIGNWDYIYSWGQDTRGGICAVRGYPSARFWYDISASYLSADVGFRPVLELPAPDDLDPDSLKVVTLNLNGGKAGTTETAQDGPVNIVVKSGGSFTAPSGEGLTRPEGNTGSFFRWKGNDGSIYAAGASVPTSVSTLTALWEPLDLSGAGVTVSGSYFYTGEAIEPPVTVTLSGAALTAGTDYTISYENNINIGTANVTVTGTGNYTGTANGTFTIGKAAQTAPAPGVGFALDYAAETVTVTGNTYELAASNTAATGTGTLNVTPGVNVYIRLKETADYSPSAWTEVTIPNRPAAPAAPLTLTKTADSITVTGSSGCEFSADGINWQDTGVFSGLTPGQTYPVSVRVKATNAAFASANQTVNVTTVNADGSTTVKPGESIVTGGGFTITNDGEKTTITGGGTTTTVTPPPGGGDISVGAGGTVTVPGGSTIEKPDGTTVTVPSGGGTFDPSTGKVTQNVCTVTFDSQGGSSVSSSQVTSGSKVTKPANPTRSGYTFGGWYKESGCTNAWNFDTDTVTGNITLYAKWTQNNTSGGSSYTPPTYPSTYPPTVERPSEGGSTATVSPSRPERGDTVTVTPKPDQGYEVDKITVTDQNGRPVEVTMGPDGAYTFIQPTGKVKIEVTYKPTQPAKTPWSNPFADVAEGDWYYEAVRFVHERGLMNGYSDGRFGPNDPLSRAQLAQILFNKEGRPVVNYLMDYSDVTGEAWYAEAVRWATSQGIVGGYGNGMFGPNDPITREQLAVMLWRYSGSPAATNKELHFADADNISDYALEALRWAVENGILNGYGDGRLGPQGLATRAQVAQMLKNFLEDRENED